MGSKKFVGSAKPPTRKQSKRISINVDFYYQMRLEHTIGMSLSKHGTTSRVFEKIERKVKTIFNNQQFNFLVGVSKNLIHRIVIATEPAFHSYQTIAYDYNLFYILRLFYIYECDIVFEFLI
mgnify:CR=1 FL=1